MKELKEGQEIIDFKGGKWIFDYYVGDSKLFCHEPNTTKFETGRIIYIKLFESK